MHHVSYELRSPLTNIIGFVHLLGDPATGPLAAKQREYLDYITVSTNTLLALINNILDLATIDAGRMQLNLGAGRYPRRPWRRRPKACRTGWSAPASRWTSRRADDIGSFIADERASAANSVQPARQRRELLARAAPR